MGSSAWRLAHLDIDRWEMGCEGLRGQGLQHDSPVIGVKKRYSCFNGSMLHRPCVRVSRVLTNKKDSPPRLPFPQCTVLGNIANCMPWHAGKETEGACLTRRLC